MHSSIPHTQQRTYYYEPIRLYHSLSFRVKITTNNERDIKKPRETRRLQMEHHQLQ